MKRDMVAAIIGAALGGTVSFFITKKMLERKYVQFAEEEIESVVSRCTCRYGRKEKRYSVPVEDGDEVNPEHNRPDRSIGNSSLRGERIPNKYEAVKQNYNVIKKEKVKEEVVEEDFDEYDDEADQQYDEEINPPYDRVKEYVDQNRKSDRPYVISEESYHEDFISHDKVEYTYFYEDDTLLDEQEEKVDDIDYYVGYESLNEFNAGLTHPREVYVRNEKISMDIMITLNMGSYQEIILGIPLEPKQRQRNNANRRARERDFQDN